MYGRKKSEEKKGQISLSFIKAKTNFMTRLKWKGGAFDELIVNCLYSEGTR